VDSLFITSSSDTRPALLVSGGGDKERSKRVDIAFLHVTSYDMDLLY
jgi:hypothetical protein